MTLAASESDKPFTVCHGRVDYVTSRVTNPRTEGETFACEAVAALIQ